MIRHKNPAVSLKSQYNLVFTIGLTISVLLHGVLFLTWKEFNVQAYSTIKEATVVKIEDIPQTRQVKAPPPPPRPAVPVEVESEEVPADETIEITDLDFDDIPVNLPLAPALMGVPQDTNEIVEFWHVEVEPKVTHAVKPVYPEVARKAGMEGMVVLHLLLDKKGNVEEVKVLKGPEIFREAAVTAAKQFKFTPALQNDKPVRVWVSQVMRFNLQ